MDHFQMETRSDSEGSRQSLNRSQSEMTPVEGQNVTSREPKEQEMEIIEMDSIKDEQPASQPTQPTPSKEGNSTIDYENRDPNNIHEQVKVDFADIIAEPHGAHSFETVWGTSYKVYSLTKFWIYRILSLIFGIPASLLWGIYFSCLAFCSVWCITPCLRSFVIKIGFLGRLWGACVATVLDPFFESIGLILSRIRVAMTVRRED